MTAPNRRHRTALPTLVALAASAALAVTAAIGLTPFLGSPAQAASPANVGLYGSSDPTYDGVFRQSLAILGLHAAGKTPDPTAVSWLLDQQCADGGFSSYNPSPAKGCPKYDPAAFTGGTDTNATSLALQALLATGHSTEAAKAAKVLRAAQEKDGGWPFIVGGGTSDPNSTGLVMSALAAAGDGIDGDGAAYLAGLQIGCGTSAQPTDPGDRGGIATPYSNGAPDVLGTVQAVPGLAGLNLSRPLPPAGPWPDGGDALPCPAASPSTSTSASASSSTSAPGSGSPAEGAAWAATWLAGQVDAKAVTGSNVGWAILSFASTHTHHDVAVALYGSLSSTLAKAKTGSVRGAARALAQSAESPGALALAALSAQTLGHSTTAKGYATRIGATITAGTASTSPSPSATSSHSATASPSTGTSSGAPSSAGSTGSADPTLPATGGTPYVLLGGVVLLGTGAGLIGLARRRRT
jgi:hypothetical protein